MILYLDSSAIVKLYIAEPHAELVREALREAAASFTHLIAYAEVRAGLAKALRQRRETPEGHALHKRELDEAWERFRVVLPTEVQIRRAADLAERFGLRGYDSVHLAAAESVREELGSGVDFRFAGFDSALARAADGLGFGLIHA